MLTIGIDIGGTKIAGAVVASDGRIVEERRRATPADDVDAVLEAIAGVIEELAATHPARAVGVAAAGFLDAQRSRIVQAPNLAWRNEPLRERLEQRVSLPIVLENDANAAGWAEYRFGAGRGVAHMTMLTIGTGIGGAIVIDGKLFRGGFGGGAEPGHTLFQPGGLPCGCGAVGCFEQYGSGSALLRMADEAADAAGPGSALASARGSEPVLPASALIRLLEDRDPSALAVLERLGENIGRGCASLGAVLDPERFVIGGGVSVAGELLLEPIRRAYFAAAPAAEWRPRPDFRVAQFANDAGVIGAAELARAEAPPS
ncbi:ROK family protein [Ruicaihuangia caeni]|uniref:ROK family protein n=1 Tax=Ruicaihuangia caeni TaxID=3042517 RepID=UPI00338FBB62